jgi:hypothetical protein
MRQLQLLWRTVKMRPTLCQGVVNRGKSDAANALRARENCRAGSSVDAGGMRDRLIHYRPQLN